MKKILYLVILVSFQCYSQEIKGYLYDHEGRVPDFPIMNTTQNLYSNTNSSGYFEIQAGIGDTIVFNSIAYDEQKFTVAEIHYESDIVIELSVNRLDEVIINTTKIKPTDIETLNKDLHNQISKDINNNPLMYKPTKGNIGYLIEFIFSLFEKEEDPKGHKVKNETLGIDELKYLFKNDNILNEKFLMENLHIPEDYHMLFFEYLSAKNIDRDLLKKEKKLDLINEIYQSGSEYLKMIKSSNSDNQ